MGGINVLSWDQTFIPHVFIYLFKAGSNVSILSLHASYQNEMTDQQLLENIRLEQRQKHFSLRKA